MPPLPSAARHLPEAQPEVPWPVLARPGPPRAGRGRRVPGERQSGTAPGSAPRGDSEPGRGHPARVSRDRGAWSGTRTRQLVHARHGPGAAKPAALVLGMRHPIPVLRVLEGAIASPLSAQTLLLWYCQG